MKINFVFTDNEQVLIQVVAISKPFGFYLTDGEVCWDGGFNSGATSWEIIEDDDPRIPEFLLEQMQNILEECFT